MTERLATWRRHTDGPLLVLAIGSLPFLIVELRRADLSPADQTFLVAVNVVVLIAFLLDYLVELAFASDRRAYVRQEWTSATIVIAQAFAVVPAFAAIGVLRFARIIRPLIVVGRVVAIGGVAAREGRRVIRKHAARFALELAAFTWLASAAAFTLTEDVGENGRVHSIGDALWWSLATMTTVGYGDVYPITFAGRVVGGITMIVGVTVFALITAKLAEFLFRGDVEDVGAANISAPPRS